MAVVQLLKQVPGSSRMLDVPKLIGQDLKLVHCYSSNSHGVLDAVLLHLSFQDWPDEVVADRLTYCMTNVILFNLCTSVALTACCEASAAAIFRSSTGQHKLPHQDATLGIKYVAAVTPDGGLTMGVDFSLSQRWFIVENLFMFYIYEREYSKALQIDIQVGCMQGP